MTRQPALAVLRDELDQRTVELDTAIAKLNATPREADEYGAVYEARWTANELYSEAWEAWYAETEKDVGGMSWIKVSDGDTENPESGQGVPASVEEAVAEASQISARLGYLMEIIQGGGPTFGRPARASNTLRDAMKRLERSVDVSNANSSGLHLSDDKGEDAMLGNDDVVQDIDLVSERCVGMLRGGYVNAQSQVFVGFQESSPSVGGASGDAGVGTSESTEGDQPRGVGEKKKHPAAVTAGCGETKTNGKQGSDFNV